MRRRPLFKAAAMGEPSDRDTEALRARARERMRQGRLPHTKAARTWGGLGTGLPCDLCDAAILASEPEFELQLDLSAPSHSIRFHRQCHSIWNDVREEYTPANDWRPIAEQLPPLGVPVEARISLGATRSIILNLICLRPVSPKLPAPERSSPERPAPELSTTELPPPGLPSPGRPAPDRPSPERPPPIRSWINATTGGPLPEGWSPIEWRYLAGTRAETPAQPADSSLPKRA